MTFRDFVRQVAVVLVAISAVAVVLLYGYGLRELVKAAAVATAICTANVLVGCYLAVWAFDRSQQDFLKALFGGMLARMAVIVISFFLLVKFTDLYVSGLTLSLFFTYILYQIVEIRFLVKFLAARKAAEEV